MRTLKIIVYFTSFFLFHHTHIYVFNYNVKNILLFLEKILKLHIFLITG